jgi:hypothetical protein
VSRRDDFMGALRAYCTAWPQGVRLPDGGRTLGAEKIALLLDEAADVPEEFVPRGAAARAALDYYRWAAGEGPCPGWYAEWREGRYPGDTRVSPP